MSPDSIPSAEGKVPHPRLYMYCFDFGDPRLVEELDTAGIDDLQSTALNHLGMSVIAAGPIPEDKKSLGVTTEFKFVQYRNFESDDTARLYEPALTALYEWFDKHGLKDVEIVNAQLQSRQSEQSPGTTEDITENARTLSMLGAIASAEPEDFTDPQQ